MEDPITVEIPSDEDDISPVPPSKSSNNNKKKRVAEEEAPILIVVDDFTPKKPAFTPTPSLVPETPLSIPFQVVGDVSIVKCSIAACSKPRSRLAPENFSGISGVICLESDNEYEGGSPYGGLDKNETMNENFVMTMTSKMNFSETSNSFDKHSESTYIGLCSRKEEAPSGVDNEKFDSSTDRPESLYHCSRMVSKNDLGISPVEPASLNAVAFGSDFMQTTANIIQIVGDSPLHNKVSIEDTVPQVSDAIKQKNKTNEVNAEKRRRKSEEVARKEQLKEEKIRKREQEKLQNAAMKAEAAAMKKLRKEKEKWEKGKFAMKSIVAEIDTKVVEAGSIGGYLLTRFAEKGITFRVTSNPIERSILWRMNVPDQISQIMSKGSEVPYVLLVYEADEFCNLVMNDSLLSHVSMVQSQYPTYNICYLTNKLISYINKREQAQYKNPSYCWRRPPVDEVLAKLTTNFFRVHSRQCIDEAELAEHVVGLTSSLATSQFRKQSSRLSVNANGSFISKDFIGKNLIKKSLWLKALVAIPKVQPRFAVAIWKKFPSMRSLLNAYMDPSKSVHEKEFLLKDLMTEGVLGDEDRRVGEICSKRVYRILMSQKANIKTDDVEDGADFFKY